MIKKYTSVLLKDLPFKIDFLLDWISDEWHKYCITAKDIQYWKSMFGKSESCEMSDVIALEKYMDSNIIDIIILIETL